MNESQKKNHLATSKTVKIDLEDEEWVEVRANLSYQEMEPIFALIDKDNDVANLKIAMPLFNVAICGWSFSDEEFTKEKLSLLDTATVLELLPKILQLYLPEKKT